MTEPRSVSYDPAMIRIKQWPFLLWIAGLSVVASLTFSVVKAARAPMTYDEAYTYLRFARQPSKAILRDYHLPNNHIAHSLLLRAVTRRFGDGPFAIRLPALAGGLVWFVGLIFLARRLDAHVGAIWLALVAWTPTLIDYNALARGYSLGCGLSFLAIVALLLSRESERKKSKWNGVRSGVYLATAGVLSGTAIGCVPVFGIVSVAATIAFLLIGAWPIRLASIRRTAARGALIAFGAVPTSLGYYWWVQVRPSKWPWGYDSFGELIQQFWKNMLNLPTDLGQTNSMWLAAGVGILGIAGLALARRHRDWTAGLLLLTWLLSIVGLVIARTTIRSLWPFPRTLLFLVPLTMLALLYAPFSWLGRWPRVRLLVSVVSVGVMMVWTIVSFDSRVHPVWRSNAGVPWALAEIDRTRRIEEPIVIRIPWGIDICVEYELLRRPRPNIHITTEGDFDYRIMFDPGNIPNDRRHLTTTDSSSGLIVLRPAPRPSKPSAR